MFNIVIGLGLLWLVASLPEPDYPWLDTVGYLLAVVNIIIGALSILASMIEIAGT